MKNSSRKNLELALNDLKEPTSFYHGMRTIVEPAVNNVVMFRRDDKYPLESHGLQSHGRFMLVISLDGGGYTKVSEEKDLFLKTGFGTLLPSFIPHCHHDMSPDHDWLFVTFQSNPTAYACLHNTVFEVPNSVYSDLSELVRETMGPQTEMNKRCVILRLEIILSTLSGVVIPVTQLERAQNDFVEEVVDYINRHIFEHIDTVTIAERFGISPGYLRRRFKDYSNRSLGKFITFRKFEHAQTLLSDRKMSVQEVANSCGFTSISTFCRRFKEITGVTPKDYRQRFPNK